MSGAGVPDKTAPAAPGAAEIAESIRQDLSAAALGDLHRLRAGLGLLTLRALLPHGEWAEFLAGAFPARAYRTLARMSADARRFCEKFGREPAAAWLEMRSAGPAGLLAAPAAGPAAAARTLAEDAREWVAPADEAPGGTAKALSDEERRLAEADRARRGLRDALAGAMGEWGRTAPEDELRDAEAALRDAADAVRIQLRIREERKGAKR